MTYCVNIHLLLSVGLHPPSLPLFSLNFEEYLPSRPHKGGAMPFCFREVQPPLSIPLSCSLFVWTLFFWPEEAPFPEEIFFPLTSSPRLPPFYPFPSCERSSLLSQAEISSLLLVVVFPPLLQTFFLPERKNIRERLFLISRQG